MLNRLFRARWRSRAPVPTADAASTKRLGVAPLFAISGPGVPIWTPRDYAALAREGYGRNAVAFRCVRLVAEAAAAVPLVLYEGAAEADTHPLAALLARPNPREGSRVFLETLYGHLLVAGNAYIEAVTVDGRPRELYALRPDRMRVVPGQDGWPQAYDYYAGASITRLTQEGAVPPILHLAGFNPTDDYYGLSAIEAAATALDVHNAASAWNKALLDNSARPSGALVYAAGEGRNLSETQFERLKEELAQQFEGARNAGRPMLLDGGLDWKALSLTPKDMDFVEAKNVAAREIALAFGVPPMLLGLPGDNTYANYAEANRAFYRSTVLPLVGRTAQAIVQWLAPGYGVGGASAADGVGAALGAGGALRLEPDLDRIEALSSERESLWRRVGGAAFLSDAEKREALGFGAGEAAGALADIEAEEGVEDEEGVEAGGDDGTGGGAGEAKFRNLGRRPDAKFDPSQPRLPAGGPEGGRWTSGSRDLASPSGGAHNSGDAGGAATSLAPSPHQTDPASAGPVTWDEALGDRGIGNGNQIVPASLNVVGGADAAQGKKSPDQVRKDIVAEAQSYVGSMDFALGAAPSDTDKCNFFVAKVLTDAGASDMHLGGRPGLGDLDLAFRAIEQAGAGLPGLACLAGRQGPARSLRPALLARPHPQGALGDADQLGGILDAQIALRVEPPRLDQALGGAFRFERHGTVRWMGWRNGGWWGWTAGMRAASAARPR